MSFSVNYLRIILNIFLLLAIISFSFILGEMSLRNWHGPGGSITTDLYIPSIMFACGKGFVNADPQQIPQLRQFLDFNIQKLTPEEIPPNFTKLELDQYQQYHRYLIYTVGFLWRFTGVSWESLRIFLAIIFSLSATLVFFIAKIYLISPLAFCVAFLYTVSPAPITILPILRDFARAIFILPTILLLCIFTSKKYSTKTQIFLSLLLGLVNGIGIGFRRDQLMFLILSLVIVFIPFSEKISVKNIAKRTVLLLLILTTFFITSYPILKSFQKFGTLGYHDTLMGFCSESEYLAGLEQNNYERVPLYNDLFVSALAETHTYHSFPLAYFNYNLKPYPEEQKKNLLLAYVIWFPADILTRIYSATARTLDKIITSSLPINMTRVYISLFSIIFFLALYPQQAFPLALILLYSSAIQSLQFNFRHNFYLSFVSPLLYSMLIQWAILLIYHLLRHGKDYFQMLVREAVPFAQRLLIYASLLIITILFPLQTFRLIQSYQVSKLFSYYLTSEMIPIPFKEIKLPDSTRKTYEIQKPMTPYLPTPIHSHAFHLSYLAVDFNVKSNPTCIDLIYDGNGDFSCTLPINFPTKVAKNLSPNLTRYFIPVLEFYLDENNWNRFIGISIDNTTEIEVKNIYKICNEDKIPLPIFFYISEKYDYIPYQQIAQYAREKKLINPCWRPYGIPQKDIIINEAILKSKTEPLTDTLQYLQEAYKKEPYCIQYIMTEGKILESSNKYKEALQVYTSGLKEHPYESIFGILIDNLLRKQFIHFSEIENIWEKITEEIPESPIAHYFYSMYISDKEKARNELLSSIQSYPELTTISTHTAEILSPREIFELLLEPLSQSKNAYSKKCPSISLKEQISFLVNSATILIEKKEFDKSKEILTLLLNVCPDLPEVYPPIISLYTTGPSPNPFLATYYARTLIDLKPYELGPINSLENIYANTPFIPVDEWISIWEDLQKKHPDSSCILCGVGRALETSGDLDSAEKTYIKATKKSKIQNDPCPPLAYFRLINLYINKNELEKAQDTLSKALKLYPDNPNLLALKERLEKHINQKPN